MLPHNIDTGLIAEKNEAWSTTPFGRSLARVMLTKPAGRSAGCLFIGAPGRWAMWNRRMLWTGIGVLALALAGPAASNLRAHCDGLDGPVVHAASRALATGNVHFALIWVHPKDEAEVRAAFVETMAVRRRGPRARRLADRAFFETLVRVHRAGEGAPYEGLKPAGRDLGPAIPAADRAVMTGNVVDLEDLLTRTLREGLRERFEKLRAARAFNPDDLAAGRAYVAAYVEYLHYAERLYDAAVHDALGHSDRDGTR